MDLCFTPSLGSTRPLYSMTMRMAICFSVGSWGTAGSVHFCQDLLEAELQHGIMCSRLFLAGMVQTHAHHSTLLAPYRWGTGWDKGTQTDSEPQLGHLLVTAVGL